MRIRIANGRLIDPANGIDGIRDLYIAEGHIQSIGQAPVGFEPDRVIDARGQIICPGLVDLSARLREPGEEFKASIASETRAAASAGVTTLCCPPDTRPVIDTPAVAELIHQRADNAGMARVVTLGAMTQGLAGECLAEMHALKSEGCVGISNAQFPITNTEVARRAMEYAATCGLIVMLHAEDPWLRNRGVVHEGPVSTRLGLPGIPESAETVAVSRDLLLIEQTGVSAHFCRLSTGRAVDMVADAQRRGLPVTADVSVYHLHLTDMDVGHYNANCHVRPPLRTERDKQRLRGGLGDGVIGAVCSDHQPHDEDAKTAPFGATEPGISSLEVLLPLTLRLVDDGVFDVQTALATLTYKPARILGLDVGTLATGAPADVCIFEPNRNWLLTDVGMQSAGKNSPFIGWELTGKVTHTLLGGVTVYEETRSV